MSKKSYGLSDEEKRRKTEREIEEYENLPWSIPINYWDHVDLNIYNRVRVKHSIKDLDAIEAQIKACHEGKSE